MHDVTSFGAIGDGRSDDTAAIKRALTALQSGDTLTFPAGKVFCHNDVLSIETPNVIIQGPGSLRATNEERSAVKIEAPSVTFENLTVGIASTSKRWGTPDQHKLVLGAYSSILVRDVIVDGSAAAGLFCLGAAGFLLQRVQVNGTRADGIHMTGGCTNGTVDTPVVSRSGDDGVAVVSYLDDKKPCRSIKIYSPTIRTTTGGRGLSVVGGQDIEYHDIDVSASNAAGVYAACEGAPSVTFPTERVLFSGGIIRGANTNTKIDHGAILVYSGRSGGDVTQVTITELTVTGTRATASRQVGVVADHGYPVSDVVFSNLELASSPQPYQGDAPPGSFSFEHVLANGKAVVTPS